MDLYLYTFARVPQGLEEGEWISASGLDPQSNPVVELTKVVERSSGDARVFIGSAEVFTGNQDELFFAYSELILPLLKEKLGELSDEDSDGISQMLCIQEDADYDLGDGWMFLVGEDELPCPANAEGNLIVSIAPYYHAEADIGESLVARPPALKNYDDAIAQEHFLVAVSMN